MRNFVKTVALLVMSVPVVLAGCAASPDAEQDGSVALADLGQLPASSCSIEMAGNVAQGVPGLAPVAPSNCSGINQAPSYQAPDFGAPNFPAPTFAAPTYKPPQFGAPSYGAPSYQAPSTLPSYTAPTYTAPNSPAPTFEGPVYQAPSYSAPSFLAPVYSAPTYAAPNAMIPANPVPSCIGAPIGTYAPSQGASTQAPAGNK